MSDERKQEAFNLIHDKALSLKQLTTSKEVKEGLDEIVALARYQFDVTGNKK